MSNVKVCAGVVTGTVAIKFSFVLGQCRCYFSRSPCEICFLLTCSIIAASCHPVGGRESVRPRLEASLESIPEARWRTRSEVVADLLGMTSQPPADIGQLGLHPAPARFQPDESRVPHAVFLLAACSASTARSAAN